MVIKTLSNVEGIGRWLDPEFDPIEQAKPTVLRLQQQRYKPEKLFSEVTTVYLLIILIRGNVK